MIYLITGNMGTGKTARAVNMILTNEDGLFKMTVEDGTVVDRPLYFCHIDGLNAAKFNAHELTREQIQSAPLDEILPTGAVLIVDEAHWTYPVRSAAAKVPEYIQKLSELRHDGFTLILMTQHPTQLDIFVRNLVSKHYHLERKPIGMKQYSWYKCVTSLDNPAAVTGVESTSWKPPEDAFKYYKSASQHQKFKKPIPLAVWALIAILCLIGWKLYTVYGIYDKNVNHVAPQTEQQTTETSSASQVNLPSHSFNSSQSYQMQGQSITAQMLVPTIPEKPETKPLYDNVRQVKTFERVAACIKGGKSGCTCYSDQATELLEISKERCLKYVKNGLPFNPYRDDQQQAFRHTETTIAPTSQTTEQVAQVTVLGGEHKVPKTEDYPERLRNIQ